MSGCGDEKITVESRYRQLRQSLIPKYGEGEATAMARLIFHYLKGWDATGLVIHAADTLSPFVLSRINEIEKRLSKNEPLQYILGETYFYGMHLKVDRHTLIPRPETAELVDMIVSEAANRSDLRVLDIGTGSGAIAIALARNLRFPQVEAVDVSEGALKVAQENAEAMHAQIKLLNRNIFDWQPDRKSFDIIVSNPPYICEKEKTEMERNVLDYEPHMALFVPDDDPLLFYRRIAEIGCDALAKDGNIYFEINPLYAGQLREMLEKMDYRKVIVHKDSSNKERFISALR